MKSFTPHGHHSKEEMIYGEYLHRLVQSVYPTLYVVYVFINDPDVEYKVCDDNTDLSAADTLDISEFENHEALKQKVLQLCMYISTQLAKFK